jgi:hypothetical protein
VGEVNAYVGISLTGCVYRDAAIPPTLAELHQRAAGGDAGAQMDLGLRHVTGTGINADEQAAPALDGRPLALEPGVKAKLNEAELWRARAWTRQYPRGAVVTVTGLAARSAWASCCGSSVPRCSIFCPLAAAHIGKSDRLPGSDRLSFSSRQTAPRRPCRPD